MKSMKNLIIPSILIVLVLCIFIHSCKKEEDKTAPKVETSSVSDILNTSATVGGRVLDDGGVQVSDRGIYWGTSTNPENTGTKLEVGAGTGAYFDTLRGLTSGVKYYIKAYATNSIGTSYGTETYFTTQISLPTVTTTSISELTTNSAKVGGNVTDSGGYAVSQRGVYWGTHTNPVLTGNKLAIGSGAGEFSQTITGLNRTSQYYVVAFATNIKGTSYGEEIYFTTSPALPSVTTYVARNITTSSVEVGGEVTSTGGAEVTERGIYWGTSANPQTTGTKLAIGSGSGEFLSTINSLSPKNTYYIVAYATNSVGTTYGSESSFITLGDEPIAKTLEATNITTSSTTLSGLISANDLNTTVAFEYGTTTSYGSIAIVAENPITENDDTVSVSISGLSSETVYHYRVRAENSLGITYGADSTFTTVVTGITGTVTDIQGNTYNTIGIGHQYWMTENLRTTKYNDNTAITKIVEDTVWVKENSGFCWYNNDSTSHAQTYGALYNWYAVNSGKLCPSGWHIPTNDEFSVLVDFLGNAGVAGGLLKITGTADWKTPNTGATNEYGFNALPGGKRDNTGVFDFKSVEGNWWSSSEYSSLTASYFYLLYNYGNSFQAYINKKNGMSVRCVKN